MSDAQPQVKIGPNDILRFLLEIFAVVSLAIWGFSTSWPAPWLNWVIGLGAPAIAIVLWGLFRSPKAVFHLDVFGRAIVEILVFGAAAVAWWDMGQPLVAGIFAVVALVSGIINGRKELA
ncbi:YrdB family protein [Rathayibacter sp. YIM 133350]|uniref:YrdB family protein n=1 Tax=Rathayibacter sp. YIM 133350 TaxID=3131992 RepID=UPI00307DC741